MLKGPKDVQVGLQGKMFLNWLKKLESSRVHVYCTSHLVFILVFIHMTLGSTLVPHSRWSPGLNMPIIAGVLKRFLLFHEMSTLLLLGGLYGFTEWNIQLINKSNICWTNKIRRWFFLFNSFFLLDWIHEKVGSLCYDNHQSCFRDPEYVVIRCGRRGCFPINTNVNTEPTFVNFLWRSFDFSLELQLLIWLIWWKFINCHSTKLTTPADVFFGLRFYGTPGLP